MLLTIHDTNLKKVAFIDNDKQNTLNYFNDTWTRYLETGSSTFEFTVFKKMIMPNDGKNKLYNYLNEKSFVSFQYNGRTYLHTIRKIEENEQTIKCYCINLNLELVNEYANPFKSNKEMSFVDYCDALELLSFSYLSIGVNEISDRRLTLEWSGSETKLARLLSLADKFGAEIEFDTHLHSDSSIKSFIVNIYHEHDDTHHGVGRASSKILQYGKNLKTITRTVDKTNIYNMIRPTGKTANGEIVTISSLGSWSVNNEKGEREFYQLGEGLYAPLSMQMYPSTFTSATAQDQWIRKDMDVDSVDPETIRSVAYRELKKNCYPAVTYEVEGFVDLDIGDTVRVYDEGFSPVLLLEMRVSEQTISFTNSANNKTTFSNAKALENRLSSDIQRRLEQIVEEVKPYTIRLSTDNGVTFKNNQGQSLITPVLYRGNQVISTGVEWRWSLGGKVTTGQTYLVQGANIVDTVPLTVGAYVDNVEVALYEINLINMNDGVNGKDGRDGENGFDGIGVRSTTVYYSESTSGITPPTSNWTPSIPNVEAGKYLWTKTIWSYTNGTDEIGYSVSKIGERGFDGVGLVEVTNFYQATAHSSDITRPEGERNYFKQSRFREFTTSTEGIHDYRTFIVDDFWKNANRLKKGFVRMSFDVTFPEALSKDTKVDIHFSASPWYSYNNVIFKGGITTKQHFEFIIDLSKASKDYRTSNIFIRFGTDYGFPSGLRVIIENAMLLINSKFATYSQAPEDGGWCTTPQSINADRPYHWYYRLERYSDGTLRVTKPAIIGTFGQRGPQGERGIQGLQGPKGDRGIAGERGVDGRTQYTHIAYADNLAGGGFSQTDQSKAYIGMYQDFIASDSQNPIDYRWSRWKGSDGAQGIPGQKGADGRTPYIHFAYANSPNGRTDFSLTQTTHKRYLGTYTDFTQEDSVDPERYKWVDMVGTVEVGGRNYVRNSRFLKELSFWRIEDHLEESGGLEYNFTHAIRHLGNGIHIWGTSTKSYQGLSSSAFNLNAQAGTKLQLSFDLSFDHNEGNLAFGIHYIDNDQILQQHWIRKAVKSLELTYRKYKRVNFEFIVPVDSSQARIMIFSEGKTSIDIYVDKIKLEVGTVPTDWTPALEDIEDENQRLQEQYTNEIRSVVNNLSSIQTVLETKLTDADLQDLNGKYADLKAGYENLKNTANQIENLGQRVSSYEVNLQQSQLLINAISSYFSFSEDGLLIGKDGSALQMVQTNEKISFLDGGKEVAYISNQQMYILSGVFVESLIVANHKMEKLGTNYTVFSYVGGAK